MRPDDLRPLGALPCLVDFAIFPLTLLEPAVPWSFLIRPDRTAAALFPALRSATERPAITLGRVDRFPAFRSFCRHADGFVLSHHRRRVNRSSAPVARALPAPQPRDEELIHFTQIGASGP